MNSQFSVGAHPEFKPANPVAGGDNRTPGAGGEIIFTRRPTSLTKPTDPNAVIAKGIQDTPIEVAQKRASEAIGEIPAETT